MDITLPEEILYDFPQFSGAGIKVYILFRKIAGTILEPKWIHCGYDYILTETGLVSKTSVRRAILELASLGWIIGFRRGYIADRRRVANQYLFSHVKDMSNALETVVKMQDFGSNRNRNETETN